MIRNLFYLSEEKKKELKYDCELDEVQEKMCTQAQLIYLIVEKQFSLKIGAIYTTNLAKRVVPKT